MNEQELVESAKKVLDGNWTGEFTIPSGTLYPHQWSWDSCFIAIGNQIMPTVAHLVEYCGRQTMAEKVKNNIGTEIISSKAKS